MKNKAMWRPIRRLFGLLLIILGIPGLVLPGLQGIAMIIAGLVLLGNKKLLIRLKAALIWVRERLKL